MKKVLFVLQIILKVFLIFTLFFIWARYFIRNIWLAVLAAALATLAVDIISRILSRKKDKSASLKLKEKEDAENMFLSLSSSDKALDFFAKLAKIKHPSISQNSKYISINHSEKSKTILFPFLNFKPLAPDDIMDMLSEIKKDNATKLVIPCADSSKEAFAFAKNFDLKIVILDKFETYSKLYKPYNCYPEITMTYKKDKALAFKDLFAFSFNKARTKGYLLSALVLFLASFIVRTSLYYCIMASTLVLFALISQFNHVYNKTEGEIL